LPNRQYPRASHRFGRQAAPAGIAVYDPAFDVTPAELIAEIITERGVIGPVDANSVQAVLQ
jgi:methylthioribose-1-phosphate isomerase